MAEYYIQDKVTELNKRVDDAFTELDTQRNRISGLTRENSELKREIIRLTDEVHNLRIFLGLFSIIAVGIWTIQWII
jgi:predicted nuclease with TOPRIM domain